MREAVFLHYQPGNTPYHNHDARLKILELVIWSMFALLGNTTVLAVVFIQLAVLATVSSLRLKPFRKALLFWLIMSLSIIVFSGLGKSGNHLQMDSVTIPLNKDGVIQGAVQSARLLTVMLAGQIFASCTDPSDMAEALRRITFFLPKKWSGALAASVSLTISFIPRILDQAAAVNDAALSRALGERRSIFRRALSLGLPLADATLQKADITSEALISRCYTAESTPLDLKISIKDGIFTLVCIIPPVLTLIFS